MSKYILSSIIQGLIQFQIFTENYANILNLKSNIQIYSVEQFLRIEYPNIFGDMKITNRILEYIRIVKNQYSYSNIGYSENNIRISEYIRIFVLHWRAQTRERGPPSALAEINLFFLFLLAPPLLKSQKEVS